MEAKVTTVPASNAAKFLEADASWWSVRFGRGGLALESPGQVQTLCAESLFEDATSAQECVVVSAYLSDGWLEELLRYVPADCEVSLHVNAGELRRKPKVQEHVRKRIERGIPPLRVRLHQPPSGMFHTKLYAFQTGGAWTVWTGSANASRQAFDRNEELMLRARGGIIAPLLEYIAALEKAGELFEGDVPELPQNDLRTLLLAGRLYLQRDWSSGLRLPIEVNPGFAVPEQSNAPQGYVGPRGKGSFDVAAALGAKQTETGRAGIKKVTVATCYGLWAPLAMEPAIEEDRQRVKKRRVEFLKRVWDAYWQVGEDKVRKQFEAVLDFATERQWRDDAYRSTWKWKPEEALRRFSDRLFGLWEGGQIRRPGKLSEELRNRMADPIFSGMVPDLFGQETEAEEFLESFFASLEVESYKTKSQNRIWHAVRDFCKLDKSQPYSADDIRLQLEEALKNDEFKDDRWVRGPGAAEDEKEDDEDE